MASEAKLLREQMRQQRRFLSTMNKDEGQFNLLHREIGREVENLDSKQKKLKTELWWNREPKLYYTFGENVCAIAKEEDVKSVAPKNEQEENKKNQNQRIDKFADVQNQMIDMFADVEPNGTKEDKEEELDGQVAFGVEDYQLTGPKKNLSKDEELPSSESVKFKSLGF